MKATYIISKLDNKKYCKTNGHFTRHLKKYNLDYQKYYEKYIIGKSPKCECGKPLTFYQNSNTYANSCGHPKCVGKIIIKTKQNWTEEQRKKDSLNKKIAAKNKSPEKIQEQVHKSRETFRKKYGTDWITQSDYYLNKSKKTKLERYGNEYYANWKQSAEKNRSKTKDQQHEINNKRRDTNLERFGVVSPFLLPEVLKKSAKSNTSGKDYILPSGKIIGVRGYENKVLDILLKTYNEEELIIHNSKSTYNIPIFEYLTVERQTYKYYPDIYIPKENKIIEVKGMWWWNANNKLGYEGRLINNLRKKDAVINAGHQYEVWLFEDKNKYQILITEGDFNKWVI